MTSTNPNLDARMRWVADELRSLAAGSSILDAGAGELRNKPLCEHLRYTSQDFCQYDGSGDGTGLQTGSWDTRRIDIVSDICAIPVPDGSFDHVICTEVLEHVPNPIAAVAELVRVLRPGGTLILTAPFASLVHFAPHYYASGFSRYWYEKHLPAMGMRIDKLEQNGNHAAMVDQELRRIRGSLKAKHKHLVPIITFLIIIFEIALRKAASKTLDNVACLGWHCKATKSPPKATPGVK